MGNKQSTIQKIYEAADGSSDLTNLLKRLNTEERKTALDSKTKDGDENATPLIIASRNGNLDSVKILLSFKADIEAIQFNLFNSIYSILFVSNTILSQS